MELNYYEVCMCSQALGFMNAKDAVNLRDRMTQWISANAPKPVVEAPKEEIKEEVKEEPKPSRKYKE